MYVALSVPRLFQMLSALHPHCLLCTLPVILCAAAGIAPASVDVTCTQPANGWPKNSFNVTLTATGGAEGCIGSNTNSTTVTTHVKPNITVAPRQTTPVCSDINTTTVTFDLSGLDADSYYNITPSTNDTVYCTVPDGSTVSAGALVRGAKHTSHTHGQLLLVGKDRTRGVHHQSHVCSIACG